MVPLNKQGILQRRCKGTSFFSFRHPFSLISFAPPSKIMQKRPKNQGEHPALRPKSATEFPNSATEFSKTTYY